MLKELFRAVDDSAVDFHAKLPLVVQRLQEHGARLGDLETKGTAMGEQLETNCKRIDLLLVEKAHGDDKVASLQELVVKLFTAYDDIEEHHRDIAKLLENVESKQEELERTNQDVLLEQEKILQGQAELRNESRETQKRTEAALRRKQSRQEPKQE